MTEIVEDELRYIVLGNIGSDAGYWVFSNGRGTTSTAGASSRSSRSRPGWPCWPKPPAKTPGLSEKVGAIVHEAIGAELAEHTGGAGVVIVAG